ncbi:MAG: type II toxin-antitoxin system RelE/ParE family toxin [Spirochaetales bacterium]|nr:type II toxin-antitoxin system RelE/ParE family toxin [Spirochaetales bacterium]
MKRNNGEFIELERAKKELKGKYRGLYSYRFSDYRIVYRINKPAIEILILRIRHRKNVYDGFY